MSTWVRVHLRQAADGQAIEQAPEEWVSPLDYGVRIDWPDAGFSLIPWSNVLRVDHQPTPTKEETP